MPASTKEGAVKRKRRENVVFPEHKKRKAVVVVEQNSDNEADIQSEILLLENQIFVSREHYNSIATLLKYMEDHDAEDQRDIAAAVALCRVFSWLMAAGTLTASRDMAKNEIVIITWLQERLSDYTTLMLVMLRCLDVGKQLTAVTLLMRLMKAQAENLKPQENAVWLHGIFKAVLHSLVDNSHADKRRAEFVEKYLKKYDDIRYYTFSLLADEVSKTSEEISIDSIVSILAAIENVPESQDQIENFYIFQPGKKHQLRSLTGHKKVAQKAWLSILCRDPTKHQRKIVLGLISDRIAPCFLKIELLMDFLTDSFNVGGSTSLMALSGLFYLMQQKNLDYPQFYYKLYSLLDPRILHSKHRSRFFRLLDTFLASTHLPAALVASFIKRLSRLSLHAPPSGIVVVVPWIYNLLKNHPSCTFMIHRKAREREEDSDLDDEKERYNDPFRPNEPDPMETDALESSLWEIQMLQSHYHPNVAMIAKIISEQFTKQAYTLEDFLDHSYGTMLDAELGKDVRKAPEVEYEIPKRILTRYGEDERKKDSLLIRLWDFSS